MKIEKLHSTKKIAAQLLLLILPVPPLVLDLLRLRAAQKGISQKAILVEALQNYFAQDQEEEFLKSAADRAFAEWNNPDDEKYDTL